MRFSSSVVLPVALLAALTQVDASEVQGQIAGETQHAEQVAVEAEAGQSLRSVVSDRLLYKQQKEKCNYECLPNSRRKKPHRSCFNSQNDCECNRGYYWNGRRCEKTCNYECWPNSSRKPDRQCTNNQDDCVCNDGYFRSFLRCKARTP
jgi:hypothetical protein